MARLVAAVLVLAGCATGGSVAEPPAAATSSTATTAAPDPVGTDGPAFGDDVLLVWVPGGLPPALAEGVGSLDGVTAATVVLGDIVGMTGTSAGDPPEGHVIPLEVASFDCDGARALLPESTAGAVCGLGEGEALLGETSARLREVGEGGRIDLRSASFGVVGTVPDDHVGAAELVVRRDDAAAAGVTVPRYALLRHDGDRDAVDAAVRTLAGAAPVRVRAPDEAPFLRHADAVLPQALVKERFGEFAMRPGATGPSSLSAEWREASIATASLPLVGAVTCHRAVLPALTGALEEIEARRLLGPVDRSASGCFNPRPIAGTDQPSRHSWGAAIDLVGPEISPEVVEVFARWGFTWGGEWLNPDPIHFEYLREPQA